jgi:small conductance mechanosensitive channel
MRDFERFHRLRLNLRRKSQESMMQDLATAPEKLGAFAAMAWAWAVEFLPRLASAAILLILGLLVARWVGRLIASFSIHNLKFDETIRPVIAAAVRYGISIIVIIAALGQLGVQTASILAVLGAAGLAIGLALQGTLSNIAAGLMLLWLRPFRVGEYIETASVAGVVREIGLFATTLDTFDGLYRFVPNSQIWNTPLVNHSRNRGRMSTFTLGIPLAADVGKAEAIAREVLDKEERILDDPAPEVFIDQMTDNLVFLGIRAWLPSRLFWSTQRDLAATLRARLDEAGITVQRMVRPASDIGDAWDPVVRRAARRVASNDAARPSGTTRGQFRSWRSRNG